ncbi:thiamine pyrophosphate-dependent enzyme [Nocardia sp. BMG111209]|uniref:thiamine pyrophosphate-dependent enzyme n=1 Tax=Nocardia sp. BMG111209 TaxID=1160137 RepID=UPI0003604BCA|nr:thiamine pyrophosphate-dependent enzyme [Nocardia sp. BMG111209]
MTSAPGTALDHRFRAAVTAAVPGPADDRPGGPDYLALFDAQVTSRQLDLAARRLTAAGRGYYSIGSSGHEGNVALAAALRVTDPALLHYRSGAFYVHRCHRIPGLDPIGDVLRGVVAATTDPISGGRHKVFGNAAAAVIPQTSTIASHLPRAIGLAFAMDRATRLGRFTPWPTDAVVLCSFGDASANHSTATGAINTAIHTAYQRLPMPILFVCEDNGLGISVPTPPGWIEQTYGTRPGLRYFTADGSNLAEALAVSAEAVDCVRATRRPVFLRLRTVRLLGHAGSDLESAYRRASDIVDDLDRDPVTATGRLLVTTGIATATEVLARYDAIADTVARTADQVVTEPKLTSAAAVVAPLAPSHPDLVDADARRPHPLPRTIPEIGSAATPSGTDRPAAQGTQQPERPAEPGGRQPEPTAEPGGQRPEPTAEAGGRHSGPATEAPGPRSGPDIEAGGPRPEPTAEPGGRHFKPDTETGKPQSGPSTETGRRRPESTAEASGRHSGPLSGAGGPRSGPDTEGVGPQSGPHTESSGPQFSPRTEPRRPQSGPDTKVGGSQPGPHTELAGPQQGSTVAQAINRTLGELLARDDDLLVFGEDVGRKGGVYGVTKGLQKSFGARRVFDTLLDEQSLLGLALGAGLTGLVPIAEIQYLAYVHNAMDQIRGEAATLEFFSCGRFRNPMVVRIAAYGYQRGFGGHFHNDDSVAALRDIPGLLIASPARADDAAAMLRTCVSAARVDGRVCLFLEPIALYHTRDLHESGDDAWLAPVGAAPAPLNRARIHGAGTDLTIVTFANGVPMSLRVAARLADRDLHARVLDLRWLTPLPVDDLLAHASATGRVLIADETRRSGGVSESVAAVLLDGGFTGPIARVTSADSFVPLGPAANTVLLSESQIEAAAVRLVDGRSRVEKR